MTFQTSPMGNKRVSEVGGIGQVSEDKLKKAGIIYASILYSI